MRLPDEEEDRRLSQPVVYTILVVSVLVLIILASVLLSNRKRNTNNTGYFARASASPKIEQEEEPDGTETDIEKLYREHKLRAEDLDFWHMYDDQNGYVVEGEDSPEGELSDDENENAFPSPEASPTASAEPTDEELAADGKHIQVFYKDGTSKWIEIDEELKANDYDFTKMKTVNGKMTYYDGNKKLSRLGVTLSEENGTIDFQALKEDGVDFVMLKIGGRGYRTGLITADKNFETNFTAAEKAGLDIGVVFASQAVSVQEATEEAKFVTDQLLTHKITYPVAFYMESIQTDNARTDILDETQKTEVIEAFIRDVEYEGYQAVLYGDSSFFLTEILTSELLKETDVWLTDSSAMPEYPYSYKMWEYQVGTTIPSSSGQVSYTISFVDYSKR